MWQSKSESLLFKVTFLPCAGLCWSNLHQYRLIPQQTRGSNFYSFLELSFEFLFVLFFLGFCSGMILWVTLRCMRGLVVLARVSLAGAGCDGGDLVGACAAILALEFNALDACAFGDAAPLLSVPSAPVVTSTESSWAAGGWVDILQHTLTPWRDSGWCNGRQICI